MTNPNDLVDATVAAIQSIAGVVTALGSAANVVAYHDEYPTDISFEQAVFNLGAGKILVAWNGTATGRSSRGETISHSLHLFLRPRGSAADLFTSLREGVCTTTGLKFKLSQVHDNCYPPSEMSCQRQLVAVAQDAVIDVFLISLSLIERGIDN